MAGVYCLLLSLMVDKLCVIVVFIYGGKVAPTLRRNKCYLIVINCQKNIKSAYLVGYTW